MKIVIWSFLSVVIAFGIFVAIVSNTPGKTVHIHDKHEVTASDTTVSEKKSEKVFLSELPENTDNMQKETPNATSSPKPKKTKKPEPSPTPVKKNTDNSYKKFFVGDAPYEIIEDVDFTSLININHRFSKNFVPRDLVQVRDYLSADNVTLDFAEICADKTVALAFDEMMNAAHDDGIDGFYLRNGYRSYNTQTKLWQKRLSEDKYYGRRKGTPLGSAYPGSSEHQSGYALDIMSVSSPLANDNFKNTKQYAWLKKNSYKYGFILRYRADKTDVTGIKFEPYHYRYVGKDLAKTLYKKGITLEEYYKQPVYYD